MAVRYGRYEVLYKLGQGAMAQVFLAKDPVLSRFVAVKVLHADLASRKDVLQRFFNEARTVAVIRNPHVVEVFDFGQEGRDLFLVMEFVDGLSLHSLLRRSGAPRAGSAEPAAWPPPGEGVPKYAPLDAVLAAALMCQAAEGLSIAAQHGVVHRDLKPENLMLNSQGYLKISDFGIAHVQDESLTKTGAVLGSPLYMSPEQARGLKPITAQSDMFSLGAVFYACLAGHPPFRGRTVTELFRGIASETHVPIGRLRPDIDPRLGNLVDTLLRKPPEERGGGPRWLQRQLKAYLASMGVSDPPELAAAHLREADARGVRTTWKLDARNATLPMTLGATQRATDSRSFRMGADASRLPGDSPSASLPAPMAVRPARSGALRRRIGTMALAFGLMGVGSGLFLGVRKIMRKTREPQWPIAAETAPAQSQGADRGGTGPVPAPGATVGDWRNSPATVTDRFQPGNGPEGASGEPSGAAGVGRVPADPSPETDPAAAPGGSARADGHAANPGPQRKIQARMAGPSEADEAMVILKSSPPFAEAYLDGRYLGMTPVRLAHLVPGRHRLALKSSHWPELDTTLIFARGIHALKVQLDPGPGLRIAATPVEGE